MKIESPQLLEKKTVFPGLTFTPVTEREAASTPLFESQNSVGSDGSDLPNVSDIFSQNGLPRKGNSALKKLGGWSAVPFTRADGNSYTADIGLTSVSGMSSAVNKAPDNLAFKKGSLSSKGMANRKSGSQVPEEKSRWNLSTGRSSGEAWPCHHGESLPSISPPKRKHSVSPLAEDESGKLPSTPPFCLNSESWSQRWANSGGVTYPCKKSGRGSATTACTIASASSSKKSDGVPFVWEEDLGREMNAPLQIKRGASTPSASATSESIPDTRTEYQKRMDLIGAELLHLNRFIEATHSMSADLKSNAPLDFSLQTAPCSLSSAPALPQTISTHHSVASLNKFSVTSAVSARTSTVTMTNKASVSGANKVCPQKAGMLRPGSVAVGGNVPSSTSSRPPTFSRFSSLPGQSLPTAKLLTEPSRFSSQLAAKVRAKPSTSTSQLTTNVLAEPSKFNSQLNAKVMAAPSTTTSRLLANMSAEPSKSNSHLKAKVMATPSTTTSQLTANASAEPSKLNSQLKAKVMSVPSTSTSQLTAKMFAVPFNYTSEPSANEPAKKKKKKKRKESVESAEGEVSTAHPVSVPGTGFGSVTTTPAHSSSNMSSFGTPVGSVNSPVVQSHSQQPSASRPDRHAGTTVLGEKLAGPMSAANVVKQSQLRLPGPTDADVVWSANHLLAGPVIDVDEAPVLLDDRYAMLVCVRCLGGEGVSMENTRRCMF